MKRTQRVQRMQRSWSSTTSGPEHLALALQDLRHVEARGLVVVLHVVVLQLALTGLVADGAVHRVVEEQELQHRALLVLHPRRVGLDRHALGDRHLAGRHQLAPGAFDTSTRHIRQLAAMERRGW